MTDTNKRTAIIAIMIVAILLGTSCAVFLSVNRGGDDDTGGDVRDPLEVFEDDVVKNSLSFDAVSNAVIFTAYAAQIGVAIYSGDAFMTVSSVNSFLQFIGANIDDGEPTIQDVLEKLEAMDAKLDIIGQKVDNLTELVIKGDAETRMGIDKVLYNQYRTGWETFVADYAEKMDDMMRDYNTDYHTMMIDLISSPEKPLEITVYYIDVDGSKKISSPDPKIEGYSIDGKVITDTVKVTIPGSYFGDCRETYSKTHRYTEAFAEQFWGDIGKYVEDNPDITISSEDLRSALSVSMQYDIITEDDAKKFSNYFINYARGLSDTNGSKLNNYYNMLRCHYNFENEAARDFLDIRAETKVDLVRYITFADLLRNYSGAMIDMDEAVRLYTEAESFIREYDALHHTEDGELYSYVLDCKVAGRCWEYSVVAERTGDGNEKFKRVYSNRDVTAGAFRLDGSIADYSVVSTVDLMKMLERYKNLRSDGSTGQPTFKSYLVSVGLIPKEADMMYEQFRTNELLHWKNSPVDRYYPEGKDLRPNMPENLPILTDFIGEGKITDENFNVICTDAGNDSEYFMKYAAYPYKLELNGAEKECWDGRVIKGILADVETLHTVSEVINGYARYDESHWYWFFDEYFSFQMFMEPMVFVTVVEL